MTSYPELNWSTFSDEHLYVLLDRAKGLYGADVKIIFIPTTNLWYEEEEVIYSRAAAKFQHLMILDEI